VPDNVPIIVLASNEDPLLAVDVLRAGADEYLIKANITPNRLLRALTIATEHTARTTTLQQRVDKLASIIRIVEHDISNDLSVANGWLHHLQNRDDLDDEVHERLDRIERATLHTDEITKTAKTFVDVLGSEDTPLHPVSLSSILAEEVEDLRSKYESATVTVDNIPDVSVMADNHLSSVFSHVLDNAVRHNESEDPHVSITITQTSANITISIADNGPGIPDSRKEAVFGKGEEGLENSNVGISLHLVYTLVDQYNGDIWIEDSISDGTEVNIQLPKAD
ncbi:MAG: ATP-binding protein, partial [Halobacteriaceae archaeon]